MVKKVVFCNFKGGVGKTTNSVMFSYELAKKGFKVLLCDLDPQANSTQLLNRTYVKQHHKKMEFPKTMMVAIQEENLEGAVVNVMKNLSLLPSNRDFVDYPDFLELVYPPSKKNYKEQRISHFDMLLKKIENEYDYIIIDCPPTISRYTDTALYSSDSIIIVLQTQQRSLDGAEAFWEYAQTFYNTYQNVDFDIAGVLPVLMKNDARIDNQIILDAEEVFGNNTIFKTIVRHMERLKGYDREGISDKDITSSWDVHDTRVHDLYSLLADEFIERVDK